MEKKQTAIEWFNDWHINNPYSTHIEWKQSFDQAKEMEKQQMIEFAKAFWYYGNPDCPPVYNEDIEKFYFKVFEK